MELEEFNDLLLKINPGQIDFYIACFVGSKGTICEIIDLKSMEIIESRIKQS